MIRGVVAGIALLVVTIATLVMVVRIVSDDRVDVTDLEVGDCFDLAIDDTSDRFASFDLVELVGCDEPHNAQVIARGDLNPGRDLPYPNDDALLAAVDARCLDVAADPRFGVVPVLPSERTWNERAGRYVCVGLAYGGVRLTGDHAAVAG